MKFHENISDGTSYGAGMNDGSTDRQTDGQPLKISECNIIPLPLFVAGHKNVK